MLSPLLLQNNCVRTPQFVRKSSLGVRNNTWGFYMEIPLIILWNLKTSNVEKKMCQSFSPTVISGNLVLIIAQ